MHTNAEHTHPLWVTPTNSSQSDNQYKHYQQFYTHQFWCRYLPPQKLSLVVQLLGLLNNVGGLNSVCSRFFLQLGNLVLQISHSQILRIYFPSHSASWRTYWNVALFTGAKFVHRLSPLRKFGRAGILRGPFTEPISKITYCNIINLQNY